jgi:hypothetical protein
MTIGSSIYVCSAVLAESAFFAASAQGQAPSSSPASVEQRIENLRAENAAARELIKALADKVDKLQGRLDREPATVVHESCPLTPPTPPLSTTPLVTQPAIIRETSEPPQTALSQAASTSGPLKSSPAPQADDRYRDGIVIWETGESAKVPFLLKFNVNTQLRYLNTLDSNRTFTDHLGVIRHVHARNDITVNRAMFILGGYIFDKRAQYSFTVWTSAGAASIVVAGNIGWRFSKAFTLTGGYTGVPGSRSLVATFPFFTSTDRSMADNFFRPGFTQGAWASGEPVKGLNYLAFVGNGLNTLSITANKIDTNLLVSGSLWWEPRGPNGVPGKSRNMYDDYFAARKVRIRLGTSFARSRENRFSDLDQSSPENTSIYNSDGV